MVIQWSGANGGLGNRMLGLSSVLAISKLLNTEIAFEWRIDDACPSDYFVLFKKMPGLLINEMPTNSSVSVQSNGWDPLRIYRAFQTQLNHPIKIEDYLYYLIKSIQQFEYHDLVLDKFSQWLTKRSGTYNLGIHIRRTDRIKHHQQLLKRFLRSPKSDQVIIQAIGIRKTLQYLILPSSSISKMENKYLAKLTKKYLDKENDCTYTLYCDSQNELKECNEEFKKLGISSHRYFPSYCELFDSSTGDSGNELGKRETSVQDALVEMLGLSKSTWIAQNTSASSFSLVASIIGKVPIVTRQPTYPFWSTINTVLGKSPYDV